MLLVPFIAYTTSERQPKFVKKNFYVLSPICRLLADNPIT